MKLAKIVDMQYIATQRYQWKKRKMERTAANIFKYLHETGSEGYNFLKELAVSPESTKKLREWSISECAEMVMRTPQTLRNLEESGKIPKARKIKKKKSEERVYSLAEINKIRDIIKTRPSKPASAQQAVLGFVNFKGGAGKTTSAMSASQYFALAGYKVLFIDCDSQASATQMFGFVPDEDFAENETLLNVLTGEKSSIKPLIKKTYWDGLDLIPANLSLYSAELEVPAQASKHLMDTGTQLDFFRRLNLAMVDIKDDYDIVILDCPPSMGIISINALYASNAIIIEMPPVIVDYASTKQFFKMVSEVMERIPKKSFSFVRILITKYNNLVSAKQLVDFLRDRFGPYIMTHKMLQTEVITKAASNLQTLYEIDKYFCDKKMYFRALHQANLVNGEIKELIEAMWALPNLIASVGESEKEEIHEL